MAVWFLDWTSRQKAEFAFEGIRQFFVDGEMEEVKLNTFCVMHETPRYGSSGFPVRLLRFALRVHARVSEWLLRELWNLVLSRTWQKETGVCERTQVDGQFRKVQAGVLVLLVLRPGDLAHVVSLLSVGLAFA